MRGIKDDDDGQLISIEEEETKLSTSFTVETGVERKETLVAIVEDNHNDW